MNDNKLFKNNEEIMNWTYPGAIFYYKDCDLDTTVISKFKTGSILRNGYFLDVSPMGGGMVFNTRFLIASTKAAKLYEVNPNNAKYRHCCINIDSYFKVMDIYELKGKTQIFLLHIPAKAIQYFSQVTSNIDEDFTKKARLSFDNKIDMEPVKELLEPFWVERTNFPVGMDGYNRFYPLNAVSDLSKESLPLNLGIRNLTGDISEINIPEPTTIRTDGKVHLDINITKEENKKGFWGRLFGKN